MKQKLEQAGPGAVGGLLSDLKMLSAYESASRWDVSFIWILDGNVIVHCFLATPFKNFFGCSFLGTRAKLKIIRVVYKQ